MSKVVAFPTPVPDTRTPELIALEHALKHHEDLIRLVGRLEQEYLPDSDGFCMHFMGDPIPLVTLGNGVVLDVTQEPSDKPVLDLAQVDRKLLEFTLRCPAERRALVMFMRQALPELIDQGYQVRDYTYCPEAAWTVLTIDQVQLHVTLW